MDAKILRIVDANLNRCREGLRVMEEHARFVLDEASLSARAKALRHRLAQIADAFNADSLLAAREIQGDVGTDVSVESENRRTDSLAVARAAAKRVSESMRCIEEYAKVLPLPVDVEGLRYEAYALEQDMFLAGGRRARLRRSRLHVLMTEELCLADWWAVCEQVLAAGADIIQLREKSLPDGELLGRARRLRDLTRRHDALLVINDRPDIAALACADGVHVGQGDLSIADARTVVGPQLLVGKSTHSLEEAEAALAERPDYLGVGPMFPSETKPDVPVGGLSLPAALAPVLADVPMVAIGGITPERVGHLVDAARSVAVLQVAVCHGIIASRDPRGAVEALLEQLAAA